MGFPPLKVTDQENNTAIPTFDINLPAGTRVTKSGTQAQLTAQEGFVQNLIKGDAADFELSTGAWTSYDDGASAVPVDGTGGSPTVISLARTSTASEVLNGGFSFRVEKSASNAQGEGISLSDLAVPRKLRGDTVQVKFRYDTLTGYVNDHYRVFLYDQTNATLLNVLTNGGGDGSLGTTPTNGLLFTGSVTLASNTASVRLIVHSTSTDATAFNVVFDDFALEEISSVNGPVIEGPVKFDPSWNNLTVGNATQDWQWTRLGPLIHIEGEITLGSTSSVTGTVSMDNPVPGTTITRLNAEVKPESYYFDNGTPANRQAGVVNPSSNTILFRTIDLSGVNATTPFTWTTSDGISLSCTFEVDEWDSGAILSTAQANVSTAKLVAETNSGQSIANSSTNEVVVYEDVLKQEGISYNSGTGLITIDTPGDYELTALNTLGSSAGWTDGEVAQLRVDKNGSFIKFLDRREVETTGTISNFTIRGSIVLEDLAQGDTLEVNIFQNSGAAINLTSLASDNYMSIVRKPDFTVFGLRGTNEYINVELTANTDTALADTWTDVSGSTLTLSPGTWSLGYSLCAKVIDLSGAINEVLGNVRIATSAGVYQEESISFFGASFLAANGNMTFSLHREINITITSETSYKLQVRSNEAVANGVARVLGGTNEVGALTDPDFDSIFFARRFS